jgi:hypothetical protein
MWTLTYAVPGGQHDRAAVVRDVQNFGKRIARRWRHLKWLAVLELHPGGHGYHVHMMVNAYVPQELVRALWGLGHTDVRLIRGKGVKDPLSGARAGAAYAAKYIAKDAASGAHERGDHRYLRRSDMPITTVEADGSWADLCSKVWAFFGGRVSWLWWSGDDPDWTGPPVLAVRSG